jgi:hypothetical protein
MARRRDGDARHVLGDEAHLLQRRPDAVLAVQRERTGTAQLRGVACRICSAVVSASRYPAEGAVQPAGLAQAADVLGLVRSVMQDGRRPWR